MLYTFERLAEAQQFADDLLGQLHAAPPHVRAWLHDGEEALRRNAAEVRHAQAAVARRVLRGLRG